MFPKDEFFILCFMIISRHSPVGLNPRSSSSDTDRHVPAPYWALVHQQCQPMWRVSLWHPPVFVQALQPHSEGVHQHQDPRQMLSAPLDLSARSASLCARRGFPRRPEEGHEIIQNKEIKHTAIRQISMLFLDCTEFQCTVCVWGIIHGPKHWIFSLIPV